MKKKNAEGFGIKLPIDSLYVLLSLLSVILFLGSFYVYFFVVSNKLTVNNIIMNIVLFLASVITGIIGFPKWIEEDREERELRRKKREYELKKCEKEINKLRNEPTSN